MLNKSIRFNFKLVENEFMALILITISTFVLLFISGGFAAGLVIILLAGAMIILNILLYLKLFRKSLFGDEANTYMTIPISMRDLIIGKVLVTVFLDVICCIINLVGVYLLILYIGDASFDSYAMDLAFGNLMSTELSPLSGAIVGTLFLTNTGIVAMTTSLLVLAVQVLIYNNGKKKNSTALPVIMLIVTFIFASAVQRGVEWVMCTLSLKGVSYLLLFILVTILTALIGWALYKFSLKKLTYEYDLA